MKEIEVNIDLQFNLDEFRRRVLADLAASATPEDEDKVLFACAGNALLRAQLLETELHVTVRLARILGGEVASVEQYELLERSLEGKTLGQILHIAWDAVQLDPASQEIVKAGWLARNELCHGFFERNAEHLRMREERLKVVEALIAICLALREASFIVTATNQGLMQAYGLSSQHSVWAKEPRNAVEVACSPGW